MPTSNSYQYISDLSLANAYNSALINCLQQWGNRTCTPMFIHYLNTSATNRLCNSSMEILSDLNAHSLKPAKVDEFNTMMATNYRAMYDAVTDLLKITCDLYTEIYNCSGVVANASIPLNQCQYVVVKKYDDPLLPLWLTLAFTLITIVGIMGTCHECSSGGSRSVDGYAIKRRDSVDHRLEHRDNTASDFGLSYA